MRSRTYRSWQAARPKLVIWQRWDVDYSLFNGSTGETHLLSELPAEVLRQLSQAPLTQTTLTSTLAGLCEVEVTPDWSEKISGILSELVELELIEPIAP